jgi:hypothetical protein
VARLWISKSGKFSDKFLSPLRNFHPVPWPDSISRTHIPLFQGRRIDFLTRHHSNITYKYLYVPMYNTFVDTFAKKDSFTYRHVWTLIMPCP